MLLQPIWDGFLLRCPKCRKPSIGKGLDIKTHCDHCGHVMQAQEGDWVGAIMMAYCFLAVILGVLVTLAAIYLDLSFTVHLLIWIPFSIAFLLGTYRNWKGVWVGLLWSINQHES
jgi:uncharacterized protein (DUF983 family)